MEIPKKLEEMNETEIWAEKGRIYETVQRLNSRLMQLENRLQTIQKPADKPEVKV